MPRISKKLHAQNVLNEMADEAMARLDAIARARRNDQERIKRLEFECVAAKNVVDQLLAENSQLRGDNAALKITVMTAMSVENERLNDEQRRDNARANQDNCT